MTLFTLLLVLAWERLFKLGEHWQLDHRLEVVFARLHRFSLAQLLSAQSPPARAPTDPRLAGPPA